MELKDYQRRAKRAMRNVIKLRNKIIKIIVLCILQIPLNPPFSKGEALFLSSSAKKMVIPPFEKGGLGGIYQHNFLLY